MTTPTERAADAGLLPIPHSHRPTPHPHRHHTPRLDTRPQQKRRLPHRREAPTQTVMASVPRHPPKPHSQGERYGANNWARHMMPPPAHETHDHLPHVSGTWPHWYVECRVDGWHAHWQTFDPVRGIRDTEHIDPTKEAAWSWLESAEQVIG